MDPCWGSEGWTTCSFPLLCGFGALRVGSLVRGSLLWLTYLFLTIWVAFGSADCGEGQGPTISLGFEEGGCKFSSGVDVHGVWGFGGSGSGDSDGSDDEVGSEGGDGSTIDCSTAGSEVVDVSSESSEDRENGPLVNKDIFTVLTQNCTSATRYTGIISEMPCHVQCLQRLGCQRFL